MTGRLCQAVILAVCVCLVTLLMCTETAGAPPIPATVETGAAPIVLPAEALAKIPAALGRFTPRTPDFDARYFDAELAQLDPTGPCANGPDESGTVTGVPTQRPVRSRTTARAQRCFRAV